MFHSSLHLLALVRDLFPSGRFEWANIALDWPECFLDAIVHSSDVLCYGGRLNIFAELGPVLVGTAPSCVLDFAPCSPENLEVLLIWGHIVQCECGALGFNYEGKLRRIGFKQVLRL